MYLSAWSPCATTTWLCLCIFAALLFPANTLAQNAGSLLQQQEQIRSPAPKSVSSAPNSTSERMSRSLLQDEQKILVKKIHFSGDKELISGTNVEEQVLKAVGKSLTISEIKQLVGRLTDFLKQNGWSLSRAYLPRQDITDGTLEITIVAGRLSQSEPFLLSNPGEQKLRIDPSHLNEILGSHLNAGEIARDQDIERAVLLIGDLPGLSGKGRFEPGVEKGTTRLVVEADEGPLLSGNVSVNNFGNRSTGLYQPSAQVNVNDPLGIGDQINFSASGTEGTQLGRVSYSLPLGSLGTRGSIFGSWLGYDHSSGIGVTAGLEGEATSFGGSVEHPIIRQRTLNFYVSADIKQKRLVDEANAGQLRDKVSNASTLNVFGDFYDKLGGGGLTIANMSLTVGDLDLSQNAADKSADELAFRTDGIFAKLNGSVTRLQKLTGPFTLYANLKGQKAEENLDSSEQFILGGPNGVRAYPAGEASGDTGFLGNLEVRYDFPFFGDLGKWQLVGFYDVGWIRLHENTFQLTPSNATSKNEYMISGLGAGINLNQSGQYLLRIDWAHVLGNNPGRSTQGLDSDGHSKSSRFWLTGTVFF
jgi:hemolysin activation/secretion protein